MAIRRLIRAAMVSLVALTGSMAQAGLTLDLTTGGSPVPRGAGTPTTETFGYEFTVLSTITVDGIGVWDAGSDGIGVSVGAGLWRGDGSGPLASATVSDASTPVASLSSDGRWLFQYFAPVTLTPGNYLIGNEFFSNAPLAQVLSPFTTDASVSNVIAGRRSIVGGLAAPTTAFNLAIFGPTLNIVPAAVVPEPGSMALLASSLLVGIPVACRRRRRSA